MWDRRVSIGHTLNENPGLSTLEALMELIIKHCTGKCNHNIGNKMVREDTFSGNKNDDAHEHVEQVIDIVSLFNILGVSHGAVMLRVFHITLTGAAKRWVDRLPLGTVDCWDLLKNAFIQRYCPPSRTAKQLEEI
ncbi:hypothetical protein Tco_1270305, partial [Tanacetum coccineum]